MFVKLETLPSLPPSLPHPWHLELDTHGPLSRPPCHPVVVPSCTCRRSAFYATLGICLRRLFPRQRVDRVLRFPRIHEHHRNEQLPRQPRHPQRRATCRPCRRYNSVGLVKSSSAIYILNLVSSSTEIARRTIPLCRLQSTTLSHRLLTRLRV